MTDTEEYRVHRHHHDLSRQRSSLGVPASSLNKHHKPRRRPRSCVPIAQTVPTAVKKKEGVLQHPELLNLAGLKYLECCNSLCGVRFGPGGEWNDRMASLEAETAAPVIPPVPQRSQEMCRPACPGRSRAWSTSREGHDCGWAIRLREIRHAGLWSLEQAHLLLQQA